MREEWDARAREDAHYYVAFGQRNQDDDGFFATASEVLASLDQELRRGTPAAAADRRILEIGCGPGRLMRPMSQRCGEIHGIDVSREMVVRAERNLAGLANAHAHVGTGATLDGFTDHSFDLVYSYAVFQHIPSRDVVFSYLREAVRVLKPRGLVRLQLNGLPPDAKEYTTWAGVRVAPEEVRSFADAHGMQLLALEGLGTQYMWTTWRKAPPQPSPEARIVRVTNTFTSEPFAPVAGRFAALSIWVADLDDDAALNSLELTVNGRPATCTYLGPAQRDNIRQLNAILPAGLKPGRAMVELGGSRRPVSLLPRPPAVPRIVSVTDGTDLLSDSRILSGTGKLTVEEFEPISAYRATIAGVEVTGIETFCVDPSPPRHEINFRIPGGLTSGEHTMRHFLGSKLVGVSLLKVDSDLLNKGKRW